MKYVKLDLYCKSLIELAAQSVARYSISSICIRAFFFYNSLTMLNGITLLTNDFYWASILRDLHANVIPTVAKEARGLKFDIPKEKISIPKLSNHIEQLKMKRLAELGGQNLSAAEQRLILLLPATANELKSAMGYAEESATHTTETLIYNIRKKMGNDYIKFNNGKYEL